MWDRVIEGEAEGGIDAERVRVGGVRDCDTVTVVVGAVERLQERVLEGEALGEAVCVAVHEEVPVAVGGVRDVVRVGVMLRTTVCEWVGGEHVGDAVALADALVVPVDVRVSVWLSVGVARSVKDALPVGDPEMGPVRERLPDLLLLGLALREGRGESEAVVVQVRVWAGVTEDEGVGPEWLTVLKVPVPERVKEGDSEGDVDCDLGLWVQEGEGEAAPVGEVEAVADGDCGEGVGDVERVL